MSSEIPAISAPPSVWSKVKNVFSAITIEPGIFLLTFGYGLQMIIAQNLLIEKACRVNFNYTEDICSHLNDHHDEQVIVQKTVTWISTASSLATFIPGVFVALFVGSWSDYHGRKPLMIAPCFGMVAAAIVLILQVYFFYELDAYYYIFTSVYAFIGGGFSSFMTGAFAYIADVTDVESRTMRIALVDICIFIGYPAGVFLSAKVFAAFGFYGVFGAYCGIGFLGALYFIFLVTDTRGPHADPAIRAHNFNITLDDDGGRRLVNLSRVSDVLRSVFRPRPNYGRRKILMLVSGMIVTTTVLSTSSFTYLYTRLKFGWTEQEYTEWSSSTTVGTACGSAIFLPFLSYKLGIRDSYIGLLCSISGIAAMSVMAFAVDSIMMYSVVAIGCMAAATAIIIRSILSKAAGEAELGKIFSFLSGFESLVPVAVTPLLNVVYNSTIETFPGAIFMVEASFYSIVFFILSYIICLNRSVVNLENRYNETDTEALVTNDSEESD